MKLTQSHHDTKGKGGDVGCGMREREKVRRSGDEKLGDVGWEIGEGRWEKGDGRREMGEGRREMGDRRREKGDGR
jgi:hypothetical protein